mgnify:CR=1 FL=1
MTDPRPTDLDVGEVLNNTYRLDQLIGAGGMGRVFSATDLKLERKVAVKALLASSLDTETVRRFDRETQVMGQLDHPGVVTLYSFGRTRGVPWLAMRLLDGADLWGTLAAAGGRMTPTQLLPVARQVLAALQYLHGRGLLHRDLKPSNIHVGKNGKVTLCDFGLARGHTSSLTRTGVVWGTPEYMAPEQILGERELDGRADLYSLAVVLFRMLAGQPLFAEKEDQELLRAHLTRPRPDICRLVPGLSPMVGAAMQKGLAIHAEDRFQSATEMLQALEMVFALPVTVSPVKSIIAPALPVKRAEGTKVSAAPARPALQEDDDEPSSEDATRPEGFKAFEPLNDASSAETPAAGFSEVTSPSGTPTPTVGDAPTREAGRVPWSDVQTEAALPAVPPPSQEQLPVHAAAELTRPERKATPAGKLSLMDSVDEEHPAERTEGMPALPAAAPSAAPASSLPPAVLIIGAVGLFLFGLIVAKLLL